ncbi:hypothetical protein FXO38_26769 [Capsicum annuum]|nr:hypothetical protein FXO38_26769 [Capsicum annuum]KAF3633065.1 hypothetical protein FXO37_27210 [Capsicum annuum]
MPHTKNILCGILIRGSRESVRDGLKTKGREAIEGIGTLRFEQSPVIEFCVDEGYMKASDMEDFGHFEHRVYMALYWKWYAYCMRLGEGLLCLIHIACFSRNYKYWDGLVQCFNQASSLYIDHLENIVHALLD